MKIWLGEHEVDGARFAVAARGIVPERVAPAGLPALLSEASVGLFEGSALELGEEGAVTLRAEAGGLTLRPGPEDGSADLEVALSNGSSGGDPRPFVEAVEAACLRLQPREVTLAAAAAPPSPWTPYMTEGALLVRTLHARKSAYQEIAVGEHPVYGRMLFLNGETQIAACDEPLYSASLVEPALGPDVRRVCILGGGDCGVLRHVLTHPVERVVMVEIDAAVIETAAEYFPAVVGGAREDPRAQIILGDAFAYLEGEGRGAGFDLIVYDLSDTPLNDATFDRLCHLVNGALAPAGQVAVQCGSALHLYRDRLAATLRGLERNFEGVATREVVIPSFLRQSWVFAFARRPGGANGA